MAKRQYTCFLDLDGVLVDFLGGFDKLSHLATGIPHKYDDFVSKFGEIEATMIIKSVLKDAGIKFWSNLNPLPGYEILVDYVTDNFMDVYILSSVENSGVDAEIGKREWLRKNNVSIPMSNVITVKSAKLKKKYADDNKILIDDYDRNVEEWRQAGGIGIHHKDIPSTIKQLQKYADFQSQNF